MRAARRLAAATRAVVLGDNATVIVGTSPDNASRMTRLPHHAQPTGQEGGDECGEGDGSKHEANGD
jgi:hypothetical protein